MRKIATKGFLTFETKNRRHGRALTFNFRKREL